MSQDYTKKFGNQLRDSTIPGLIANMIREVQQQSPLFQTAALGGLGGGGASGGQCGLNFNPSTVQLQVPPGSTGNQCAAISVTSQVAQTVTFTASSNAPPISCTGGTSLPAGGGPVGTGILNFGLQVIDGTTMNSVNGACVVILLGSTPVANGLTTGLGSIVFQNIAAGAYTVTISANGYTTNTSGYNLTTSVVAQFTISESGSSGSACLGVPSVNPSTLTFTAGQTLTIVVCIPYTNCNVGATANISVSGTTSLGCTFNNTVMASVTTVVGAKPCQNALSAPIWITGISAPWTVYLCPNGACSSTCPTYVSGPAGIFTPVFLPAPPTGKEFCVWAGGFQYQVQLYYADGSCASQTGPGIASLNPGTGSGTLCQKTLSLCLCYSPTLNCGGVCSC